MRRAPVRASTTGLSRRFAARQPRTPSLCLGRQPGAAQTHGRQPRLAGPERGASGVFFRWRLAGRGRAEPARTPGTMADGNLRQLGNRRYCLAPRLGALAALHRRCVEPGQRRRAADCLAVLAERPCRTHRRLRENRRGWPVRIARKTGPDRQTGRKTYFAANAGTGTHDSCLGRRSASWCGPGKTGLAGCLAGADRSGPACPAQSRPTHPHRAIAPTFAPTL
ncbi:hypothetical protein D3C84_741900 [compost metagenome]